MNAQRRTFTPTEKLGHLLGADRDVVCGSERRSDGECHLGACSQSRVSGSGLLHANPLWAQLESFLQSCNQVLNALAEQTFALPALGRLNGDSDRGFLDHEPNTTEATSRN